MPEKSKMDVSPKKSEDLSFCVPEYNVQKKVKSNMCYEYDPRPDCSKNMPSFSDKVRNSVIKYNSSRKRTLALSGTFTAASVSGMLNDHYSIQSYTSK